MQPSGKKGVETTATMSKSAKDCPLQGRVKKRKSTVGETMVVDRAKEGSWQGQRLACVFAKVRIGMVIENRIRVR